MTEQEKQSIRERLEQYEYMNQLANASIRDRHVFSPFEQDRSDIRKLLDALDERDQELKVWKETCGEMDRELRGWENMILTSSVVQRLLVEKQELQTKLDERDREVEKWKAHTKEKFIEVHVLQEENQRLRKALQQIADKIDHPEIFRFTWSDASDIAHKALAGEETE